MFSKAKIGDRVWDFRNHWGTITKRDKQYIYVIFDCHKEIINEPEQYDFNGKANGYLAYYFGQTLFWNEIQFDIPKKPFDLKSFFKDNFTKYWDVDSEKYYLEHDNNNIWKFVKDTDRTIIGAHYFVIESAYTPEELSDILNENEVKFIEVSMILKEIW